MAHLSLTSEDFTGFENLVVNDFKSNVLQAYIDTFYKKYLREIIGDEAYILIGNEARQKWTDLLNGVEYINSDGKNAIYDGLKVPLVRFIYFEFIRDNFTSTQTGKVSQLNENSTKKTPSEVIEIARSRYNSAAFIACDLEPFLEAYEKITEDITGFVDNGGGSYTVNVASTKYLINGDSITYNNTEYTVSSVVADTSFNVTLASAGLTIEGSVFWKPYEKVDFKAVEIVGI